MMPCILRPENQHKQEKIKGTQMPAVADLLLGTFCDDDWITFEENLLRSWANIFRRETRLRNDEEEQHVGYKILCDTRDVTAELGGSLAHRYLAMGTSHRFADRKKLERRSGQH